MLRQNWIVSINAAVREHNIPYNRFINSLNKSNIELNRKILSEMAKFEPYSFKSVLDEVKIQGNLKETLKD